MPARRHFAVCYAWCFECSMTSFGACYCLLFALKVKLHCSPFGKAATPPPLPMQREGSLTDFAAFSLAVSALDGHTMYALLDSIQSCNTPSTPPLYRPSPIVVLFGASASASASVRARAGIRRGTMAFLRHGLFCYQKLANLLCAPLFLPYRKE
jgi:hypothetical protein